MDTWDSARGGRTSIVVDKDVLCGGCNTKMIKLEDRRYKCPECGQNYLYEEL